MYGKTVYYHGIAIWVAGLPSFTEKEWQERAKDILQILADREGDRER